MSIKETMNVKGNLTSIWRGAVNLTKLAAVATVAVILAHDVATGESLISKSWNSAVVSNAENSESCKKPGFCQISTLSVKNAATAQVGIA